MKINLKDPCHCGHTASFHEREIEEYALKPNQETIKIVRKVHGFCNFDRTKVLSVGDPTATEGCGFDYTNFGRYCRCNEFKLDNLKYLENLAE